METKSKFAILFLATFMFSIFTTSCRKSLPSTASTSSAEPMVTSNSQDLSISPQVESQTDLSGVSLIFETQSLVLDRINNSRPLDELITKDVDINVFINKYCKNPYITFIGDPPNIKQVDTDFGIECIRKTDTGTLYSVHKVKQGGLLYIFYRNRREKNKDYQEIHNWFYVKRSLFYKDFASIKKGSGVEDVEAIDPNVTVYKDRMYSYNNNEEKPMSHSMHYLKDGTLSIFYTYKDGAFAVESVEYKKNFQVDTYFYGKIEPYDGNILPIDFID